MRLNFVFSKYAWLSVVIILLFSSISPIAAQEIARPLTFGGPRFVVDDFDAHLHSDGKILLVSGKVENKSASKIQGYVTIYLKNSGHEVLNAIDIDLKNGKIIKRGDSGFFEAKINIENYAQLANVSIEFIEEKRYHKK